MAILAIFASVIGVAMTSQIVLAAIVINSILGVALLLFVNFAPSHSAH